MQCFTLSCAELKNKGSEKFSALTSTLTLTGSLLCLCGTSKIVFAVVTKMFYITNGTDFVTYDSSSTAKEWTLVADRLEAVKFELQQLTGTTFCVKHTVEDQTLYAVVCEKSVCMKPDSEADKLVLDHRPLVPIRFDDKVVVHDGSANEFKLVPAPGWGTLDTIVLIAAGLGGALLLQRALVA